MKKHDENLFQIGEVCKIMDVTRKALLVYENAGLVIPAVKDEESGYRYYSAENITQIQTIRALQTLGLSLKDISAYFEDIDNIDAHLQRLMDLRTLLNKNIRKLQYRAAQPGDLTVRRTVQPAQVCFCRRYDNLDISLASTRLRETYVDAARTGKMSSVYSIFTMRLGGSDDKMDLMCCIPVDSDYNGPERVDFGESPALCIYYRGAYKGIPTAVEALLKYAKENNIELAGPFRSVYLEGPPSRGDKEDEYITQVAVPIKW